MPAAFKPLDQADAALERLRLVAQWAVSKRRARELEVEAHDLHHNCDRLLTRIRYIEDKWDLREKS